MYKISIVVPVYNTAEYLPKCLDSLIHQTYQNIEIICVNDGSTDNSSVVLQDYRKRNKLLKVIDQTNRGVSYARNAGIAHATGDYLMFVDSDDWVDENICENLLNKAIENDADCVMCSYCKEYEHRTIINHIFEKDLVWDEISTRNLFYRRLFGPIGKETARPFDVDLIVSPCMQLFRYDICKDIRFIDTNIVGNEDCLFQMMVYKNCKQFVYIDQPMYHYRKTNEESFTTKYNPYLFERWQHKYSIMEKMIQEGGGSYLYHEALNNRIIFALIGLGLNEITADVTVIEKAKRFDYILSRDRYQKAFKSLNTKYMAVPWKIYFVLLKYKCSILVVLMLQIINYIRKR